MVTKNVSKEMDVSSENMNTNLMKKLKFVEEERLKTFTNWQYNESQNCSALKMAEAGFFFTGGTREDDDAASCYVCGKDLVSRIDFIMSKTSDCWFRTIL